MEKFIAPIIHFSWQQGSFPVSLASFHCTQPCCVLRPGPLAPCRAPWLLPVPPRLCTCCMGLLRGSKAPHALLILASLLPTNFQNYLHSSSCFHLLVFHNVTVFFILKNVLSESKSGRGFADRERMIQSRACWQSSRTENNAPCCYGACKPWCTCKKATSPHWSCALHTLSVKLGGGCCVSNLLCYSPQ